ncbi:unnamed protein product [Orchesella dallaii]|uniref:DUF4789 domain-containing protein n=1 Tax=Orchesella dallaii TaxID=48710 RepID=A0ABP1PY04_9HEXA
MTYILKIFIIAIIGISDAVLQQQFPCNDTKSLEEAAQFRPIAEGPGGVCYLAYGKGPCEDGKWFALTWDHKENMLSTEGNCTTRLCTEITDEGNAESYRKFSFYYEGKCLISGTRNSDYCKDDLLYVYFNHYDFPPICKIHAPEVEVQEGRFFGATKYLNGLMGKRTFG